MKIVYRETGEVIAAGKRGWAITPFEGNYYISRSALTTQGFKTRFVPGLCIYKFLYVWLDFHDRKGGVNPFMGWRYWLPNPILPFIWFRVAVSARNPDLLIIEDE